MAETATETLDWEKAIQHGEAVMDDCKESDSGTDKAYAMFVIVPLIQRYQRGERTAELHKAIMELS